MGGLPDPLGAKGTEFPMAGELGRVSRTEEHAMAGSQDYAADPRNAGLLIYLNGALVPREEAKVSIFDAGFVLGDGVWEGLRVHKGALLFLDAHMDRLY